MAILKSRSMAVRICRDAEKKMLQQNAFCICNSKCNVTLWWMIRASIPLPLATFSLVRISISGQLGL